METEPVGILFRRFAECFLKQSLTEKQVKARRIPKYLKPEILVEIGQFPFRCPMCWNKHVFKEQAKDCLNRCWEKLPEVLWGVKKVKESEPEETGSWQWDIGADWCGISYFSDGSCKYFKSIGRVVSFISISELEKLLAKGCTLHQKNEQPLPESLKRFENVKRTGEK